MRPSFAQPDELLLYYFQQAGVDTSGDVEVEIEDAKAAIVRYPALATIMSEQVRRLRRKLVRVRREMLAEDLREER